MTPNPMGFDITPINSKLTDSSVESAGFAEQSKKGTIQSLTEVRHKETKEHVYQTRFIVVTRFNDEGIKEDCLVFWGETAYVIARELLVLAADINKTLQGHSTEVTTVVIRESLQARLEKLSKELFTLTESCLFFPSRVHDIFGD